MSYLSHLFVYPGLLTQGCLAPWRCLNLSLLWQCPWQISPGPVESLHVLRFPWFQEPLISLLLVFCPQSKDKLFLVYKYFVLSTSKGIHEPLTSAGCPWVLRGEFSHFASKELICKQYSDQLRAVKRLSCCRHTTGKSCGIDICCVDSAFFYYYVHDVRGKKRWH